MHKMFLILGLLLFAVFLSAAFYINNQVYAISGCCKERYSHSGQWVNNGLDFENCSRVNAERDRDNVFDATGFIWWDVTCR